MVRTSLVNELPFVCGSYFISAWKLLNSYMDGMIHLYEKNRGKKNAIKSINRNRKLHLMNNFNPKGSLFGFSIENAYGENYFKCADGHHRLLALEEGYDQGIITKEQLMKWGVHVEIVSSSEFLDLYDRLNSGSTHSSNDYYGNSDYAYGFLITRIKEKVKKQLERYDNLHGHNKTKSDKYGLTHKFNSTMANVLYTYIHNLKPFNFSTAFINRKLSIKIRSIDKKELYSKLHISEAKQLDIIDKFSEAIFSFFKYIRLIDVEDSALGTLGTSAPWLGVYITSYLAEKKDKIVETFPETLALQTRKNLSRISSLVTRITHSTDLNIDLTIDKLRNSLQKTK